MRIVKSSITGFDSSRRAISSTCARAAASASASTVRSTCLPMRTAETFVHPIAGSAPSTALPCGSSSPGFSDTRTSNRCFIPTTALPGSARDPPPPIPGPRSSDHPKRAGTRRTPRPRAARRPHGSGRPSLRRRRRAARAAAAPCSSRESLEPVADELLVERRLRPARRVAVGRPEARGVRREHLVDQDQLAAGRSRTRTSCRARISPRSSAISARALVDRERQLLQPLGEALADELLRLGRRERQVVALGRPWWSA